MISRISAYSSRRYHGAKCIPGPLKKARSLRAPKTGLNQTGSAEVGSHSADSIEIFIEAGGSTITLLFLVRRADKFDFTRLVAAHVHCLAKAGQLAAVLFGLA